jgi:hypothetical protein
MGGPVTPQKPACPRCQGTLRRVPRQAADLLLAALWPVRRYRCRSCAWEVLRLPSPQHAKAGRRRIAILATCLGVAAFALLAAWPTAGTDAQAPLMVGGRAFAAGEHFTGTPLSADHPLLHAGPDPDTGPNPDPATTLATDGDDLARNPATPPGPASRAGLTLRRHCAWGDPGRSPYRGTPEQALQAAGLPTEVIAQVALSISLGERLDRVTIRRGQVRAAASGLEFDPRRIALTYGTTLCLDTAVNFAPGHVEEADLFVATDDAGQLHYVMVPDVCGNVSVLRVLDGPLRTGATGGEAAAGQPAPPPAPRAAAPPALAGPATGPSRRVMATAASPGAAAPIPVIGASGAPGPPRGTTLGWIPAGGIRPHAAPTPGPRKSTAPPPGGGPPGAPGPLPTPEPPALPWPDLPPPAMPFPPPPPPLLPPGPGPGPGPGTPPVLLTPPQPPQRSYPMSEPGSLLIMMTGGVLAWGIARRRGRPPARWRHVGRP